MRHSFHALLVSALVPSLLVGVAGCSSSSSPTPAAGSNVAAGRGGGTVSSAAGNAAAGAETAGGAAGTGNATSAAGDSGAGGARQAAGGQATGGASGGSLSAKYQGVFPIGVALSLTELNGDKATIGANFNHLTCGNAMKGASIHPAETTWTTTEADALADFARASGWKMTGHTLVWYRQQAAWMFAGLTAGDPASIETLKGRLKTHIEYMVNRYGDVVDNWDVVNEAISDDSTKTYRDSNNQWYTIFGSEEYIYWAYKYTYDALEAKAAGSAKGKLYYNDYNETQKIDRILTMATWLKGKGVTLDGIGFQAHWRMDWPTVSEIEGAITKAVTAGYKVKVSELDITLYNDYPAPTYSFLAAPAVAFTADLETQQATRYAALFTMLRAHATDITSVTVWGFADDQSWLNNEPVSGRRNYPLLFNDAHQPKQAFVAIQNF